MKILDIIVQPDYILKIFAEDGRIGYFDVKPYLHFEAFEPLKEFEEFNKIYNGKYYIEWNCGADLSADSIESNLEIINNDIQNVDINSSTQNIINRKI